MKIVTDKARNGPVGQWVAKKLFSNLVSDEGIGLERRGDMVAGVVYENWNRRSITCHIAVQGLMTPYYLHCIFHYPFVHLGCEKILAPVAQGNDDSIQFVENLGFEREATLSDFHPDGDLLLYTMRGEDCRFLGERYGKRQRIATACA